MFWSIKEVYFPSKLANANRGPEVKQYYLMWIPNNYCKVFEAKRCTNKVFMCTCNYYEDSP